MWTFAISLACAGIVLSLFARLPVLLAVLLGTVLAILVAGLLSVLGVTVVSSTLSNVLVAVVALQCGYGLGIVARAVLRGFLLTRTESRAETVAMSSIRTTPPRPESSPNARRID